MKAILKADMLILVPECTEETERLAAWKAERADHVFAGRTVGSGLALRDLGVRATACREPINVTSRHPDPAIQLIGNFAETPFVLDGEFYASVEGFWQGLKFDDATDRRRVAAMAGGQARRAGEERGYGESVSYRGLTVRVGSPEHWKLMEAACRAKFTGNAEAREALLATGERPLQHRMRRDSRSIPGVVMADIWMRIRASLAEAGTSSAAASTATAEERDAGRDSSSDGE